MHQKEAGQIDGAGLFGLLALAAYVITSILFSHTQLLSSFSDLPVLMIRQIGDSLSIALACCSLCFRKREVSTLGFVAVSISAAVLFCSGQQAGDFRLFICLLVVASVSCLDIDLLGRIYGLLIILIVSFVILFSIMGVLYNPDFIPNGRVVFSYGFSHPNFLAGLLFSGNCALAVGYWKVPRAWHITLALSLLCSVFAFVSLSSRAGGVLCATLSIAILVFHIMPLDRLDRRIRWVGFFALVAVPLFALAVSLFYTVCFSKNSVLELQLNDLFNGRLFFAHKYYVEHGGISLWGRPNYGDMGLHNGQMMTIVDNGYAFLTLIFGALSTVVVSFAYGICAFRFSRVNSLDSGVWAFVCASILLGCFYLLIEKFPLFPYVSFSSLALFRLAFRPFLLADTR